MTETTIEQLTCGRCGWEWYPRSPRRPNACPACKSPYWDRDRIVGLPADMVAKPRRRLGGHAPGDLREAFQILVEHERHAGHVEFDGERYDAGRLVGKMWHCTDTMPASTCGALDLPGGSTYAQGARAMREVGMAGRGAT